MTMVQQPGARTRLQLAWPLSQPPNPPVAGRRVPRTLQRSSSPFASTWHALRNACNHSSFVGLPQSRLLVASGIRLEPRLLPSIGVTRLPRSYEPLRHPTAPDPSLTGCRLIVRSITRRGFPCCLRFPCVHAVATTPAQRLVVLHRSFRPVVSAFPERVIGSACASTFSRIAQRSLALRPAHSLDHLSWPVASKASATSLPP